MGRKVGFKRSDRRYQSDDGQLWDSEFEWKVFNGLRSNGYRIRRCDEGDTVSYHTPVKQGRCVECGSNDCVQERTYTPDIFVVESPCRSATGRNYYIECKGYFPAEKRSLLRAVAGQSKGVDLRIVFERLVSLKGTKGTNVDYVHKYLKIPVGVWDRKEQRIVWYESP
jgi:hypothetical protein